MVLGEVWDMLISVSSNVNWYITW